MASISDLASSEVTRLVADNFKKTQRGPRPAGAPFVDVAFIPGRKKAVLVLVNGEGADEYRRGKTFAATLTTKGWKPLPAMNALSGKKIYTDAEAAEAVRALFAAVER